MAEDPPRQPVVLRIKVRYATADAFVERFAPYVARAGLFLRSKTPKPVGTEVRFELRLSDDVPVLVGMGVVRWARVPDPDKPYTPPGMAIEFTRVTKESRGVILKMLELRRALCMTDGPRGLPAPPDDDVAVIAATTAAATAAAVAAEIPPSAVPESAPDSGAVMMTGPVQAVIAVETAPVAAPPQWNGPAAPTQLEPLVARPRRPAAAELVASMSAATLTGLDNAFGDLEAEEADVPGILARARAMVGHDLDGELANLLDQDAAPVAITIEEASAGLASLFGTAPVSKRNRRAADDSVPVPSRPAFSAPPPVTASAAVVTAAAAISADLFAPVAPEPADTQVEPAQDDPPMRTVEAPTDDEAETRAAEAEAAAAVAALVEDPANDPDRTRVVKLDGLAELTGAPPEGATRVVSLDALAAASAVRDSDERTAIAPRPEAPGPDEERTRVVPIRAASVDEDARTRIVHARELDRAADELDETLDFDRPARPGVPRDFADEPEVNTSVRMRPLPPGGSGPRPATGRPPERAARRTSPPPPPGRRVPPDAGSVRRASSPAQALAPLPLADDSHDEDMTPPPVDPGDLPTHSIDLRAPREPTPVPARLPRAESSGSFELDDLVAELSAEAATPVPVRPERSAALDGLGRSLAGDALDADGIMADLDDLGRRRAPEGPFPDLASFADPPSAFPRRSADRADSLDAALAALDADDDEAADAGEERTHFERPPSHPAARPEGSDDDDDSLEIEIELDE